MFQEPTIESRGKTAEIDQNNLKIIILGILGVGASAASTHFFLRLLSALTLPHFLLWLGCVSLFLIFVVLQALFVKRLSKLFAICALECLAVLPFFISQLYPVSVPLLVGFALFAVFFVTGVYEGWKFIAESLSLRFSFVSRNILSRVATGLLIFLSVVTYVWYFDLGRFNPEDGKRLVAGGVVSIEPALRVWFPGTSMNDTVESFFRKAAESELRKLPEPQPPQGLTQNERTDFQVLTKQQQERAIAEGGEAMRQSFEKTFGPLPKTALVKDAFYAIVSGQIQAFSAKTRSYFGLIVALLVFSTFRSLFALFLPFVRLLSFFLYKLLVITGFAYVTVETRNREFIMLS
jgi:hypothetical protein